MSDTAPKSIELQRKIVAVRSYLHQSSLRMSVSDELIVKALEIYPKPKEAAGYIAWSFRETHL